MTKDLVYFYDLWCPEHKCRSAAMLTNASELTKLKKDTYEQLIIPGHMDCGTFTIINEGTVPREEWPYGKT